MFIVYLAKLQERGLFGREGRMVLCEITPKYHFKKFYETKKGFSFCGTFPVPSFAVFRAHTTKYCGDKFFG